MRNQLGAGLQFVQQPGPKLEVDAAQQVHRHDVRVAEIGLEEVCDLELGAIRDARRHRVHVALVDPPRIDVDADGALDTEVPDRRDDDASVARPQIIERSEEHTSELQSLMRNSYAVFCLKKNT